MVGLKLREEFQGKLLKGTAIELANNNQTGATQQGAAAFLRITYPTHDLIKAIHAIGPDQARPVVVIGERGAGKSHLMAALYHAASDAVATRDWLKRWAHDIKNDQLASLPLRTGMRVIADSLQRQRYKYLWDVLLENHPHGKFIRGKWEGAGVNRTDVMPQALVLELLQNQPVMLLLDEFQTWFDGLANTPEHPAKAWAFNFIQILSEVAKEHPALLVLAVSVRHGGSDAYQQIHRVNPVPIDFLAGGNPQLVQEDRRRMLLHRLFENRLNMSTADVQKLVAAHVDEYLKLAAVPAADQERRRREFVVSWPFAPHLLRLLEEQVLVATDAQENRDLIRILANLFKSRGEKSPVLTAADFSLNDDTAGIGALLDSVANAEHRTLRAKAQQNITAVRDAVPDADTTLPHLNDLMAALWLRSIAVGNRAGADASELQIDLTRSAPLDGNAFAVELATVVANSFNIHRDGQRLVFRSEENPQARLMAQARNDRLFADGRDKQHLARELRYVLTGETGSAFVIVLAPDWRDAPWAWAEGGEHPAQWTDQRPPLLVLPCSPEPLASVIGPWLKQHLQARRNTVRFLLPRAELADLYLDRELIVLARATLTANEWSVASADYRKLHARYQGELRDLLKKRFDRFAVLQDWSFQHPEACHLHIEPLRKQGTQIPESIQDTLLNDLFEPETFAQVVVDAAQATDSLGKLIRELQEPRPNNQPCVPWLGEVEVKERVLQLCARGLIALNVRGTEFLQAQAGESEAAAWTRLRSRLPFSGRQLDEVKLLEPGAVPATGGTALPPTVGLTHPHGTAATPAAGPLGMPPSPSHPTPLAPLPPLFGGAAVATPAPSAPNPSAPAAPEAVVIALANASTSALNQLSQVRDHWGIQPKTALADVTLTLPRANGEQLMDILRKLPEGVTVALSLHKVHQ